MMAVLSGEEGKHVKKTMETMGGSRNRERVEEAMEKLIFLPASLA